MTLYEDKVFNAKMLGSCIEVYHRTNLKVEVQLAQIYRETMVKGAPGASLLATSHSNYAGIKYRPELHSKYSSVKLSGNRVFVSLKDLWDWTNVYSQFLGRIYYRDVLSSNTAEEQIRELGKSPWSQDHYCTPAEASQGLWGQRLMDLLPKVKIALPYTPLVFP